MKMYGVFFMHDSSVSALFRDGSAAVKYMENYEKGKTEVMEVEVVSLEIITRKKMEL